MFTSLVFLKYDWKTRHKSKDMKTFTIIAVLFFLSDGCKITESGSLLNTFSKIWLIWKSCEYDKKELCLYKNYKTIKYGLFQYQCSPPLHGKSIRKEIPAYRSEVRFIQNARKQKYLMDSNLMYTDFIKAHDGLNLGRLENVQLREILSY